MKKFWKIIAATFTMSSAFGAQSVFACARTLELPEFFSWKFPIVLNVDSEKVVSENTYFIEPAINQDFATIFVKEGVTKSVFKLYSDFDSFEASLSKNNKRPFEEIVNRVNLGKAETIAPLISSEKDLKRSIKFVEMMGIKDLQIKCIVSVPTGENKNQDLNMYLCVFFESKSSKLRPDMNYMAFEFGQNFDDPKKWNISAKSNLLTILSESVRFSEPTLTTNRIQNFNFLSRYTDLTNNQNQDNAAYAFYKKIQKDFYALELEKYSNYMTPKSKEIFTKQFLGMTKKEQAEALKDYFSFTKVFYGVYDTGKVKIIVFKRTKNCGQTENYDCAFILETPDGFKLCNVGQPQGAFADYIIDLAKAAQ